VYGEREREREARVAREGERKGFERGRAVHCEVIRRGKNVTEGDFCSTGAIPKNTLSPALLFFGQQSFSNSRNIDTKSSNSFFFIVQ